MVILILKLWKNEFNKNCRVYTAEPWFLFLKSNNNNKYALIVRENVRHVLIC